LTQIRFDQIVIERDSEDQLACGDISIIANKVFVTENAYVTYILIIILYLNATNQANLFVYALLSFDPVDRFVKSQSYFA
jgi:hypothetical protein